MVPRLGLLLLGMTLLATFRPTDYAKNTNITPRCQKKVMGCGEFLPPVTDVGKYDCKFNSKTCVFLCYLRCPRKKEYGVHMPISNRRHAKEVYLCSGSDWKRKDTPQAFCMAKQPVKEVLQNFHHVDELNELVNVLFNTSYSYLGMALFYERADVALPGFSKYMTDLWEAEMKHARDVMSYVNKRGGFITLYDIPRPSTHEMLILNLEARPGLAGLDKALQTSRDVNERVQQLHKDATKSKKFGDPHLKSYLEDGIISHKVETIKKIADLIKKLRAFPDEDYALGEYAMDIELRK